MPNGSPVRDSQRKRLYDAERSAFGHDWEAFTEDTILGKYVGTTYEEGLSPPTTGPGSYRGLRQSDGSILWYRVKRKRTWNPDVLRTVAECQAFVDSVTSSDYWHSPPGRITVRTGRGARWASARKDSQYGRSIVLPLWSRTRPVIVHELTHHHTPDDVAWHGPEYVAHYLYLTLKSLGRAHAERLARSFTEGRIKVNLDLFRSLVAREDR